MPSGNIRHPSRLPSTATSKQQRADPAFFALIAYSRLELARADVRLGTLPRAYLYAKRRLSKHDTRLSLFFIGARCCCYRARRANKKWMRRAG